MPQRGSSSPSQQDENCSKVSLQDMVSPLLQKSHASPDGRKYHRWFNGIPNAIPLRMHSTLDYVSPMQFEKGWEEAATKIAA